MARGQADDYYREASALEEKAGSALFAGNYAEAELAYRQVIELTDRYSPMTAEEGTQIRLAGAATRSELANLYVVQARYAEAEPLIKTALAAVEQVRGPDNDHMIFSNSLAILSFVYRHQGRYAEAEVLCRKALALEERARRADSGGMLVCLASLANVCSDQGRYAEAGSLLRRALTISEKVNGPQDHAVAYFAGLLASTYCEQHRYADAEALCKRAIAIMEKTKGLEITELAMHLNILADVYRGQRRYAEAEPLLKRAVEMVEKSLGTDHPSAAGILSSLANIYCEQKRYGQAEPLLDRVITIQDRSGAAPGVRSETYYLRALIAWEAGRRGEALADLRQALVLAEQQRGNYSGAEWERAASFISFAQAFERMVAWQAELGDSGEAFQAMERAHARSLLDEIGVAGADLSIGRTLAEREQLRQREGEIRSRIAGLQKQFDQAKDADARSRLQSQLAEARAALYEYYRDERSGSPVYRNLLSTGAGPPRLSQLQRRLPPGSLLLTYLFGEDEGFVLIAGTGPARVVRLAVPEAEARALGIKAGPLTARRLQEVLIGEKDNGLVTRLANASTRAEDLASRLASLWRVLVPEAERKAILEGKARQVAIIPDGPLALLPFEALVVEEGREPKYLLDVGPPILYAPSATVLYNLTERTASKPAVDREPVLAVGDPAYGEAGAADPTPATSVLAAITSSSRYSTVGGRLTRLPYTNWEIQWLSKGFGEAGIKVGTLSRATATERGVRYWSPGRRILHLACHGLADQGHGNFFGALALTPGPKSPEDPADDGFLTLPEIYELNLKGTDLTILSACQTNYGPQQKGEGTWALSRGFLVAGSRRVVASNWLVDDEAAASLVSVFCAGLAQAEKAGKPVDHAESLQAAKRWVRQQDKWKSPYYWASMVLIGPP
jgi:CHAT domain-containing protein